MAHYAILDKNNIVELVIVGIDENSIVDGKTPEQAYSDIYKKRVVRTSYNHKIRKRYAGIGYSYNEELDAFIPPKPEGDFVLDAESCDWVKA